MVEIRVEAQPLIPQEAEGLRGQAAGSLRSSRIGVFLVGAAVLSIALLALAFSSSGGAERTELLLSTKATQGSDPLDFSYWSKFWHKQHPGGSLAEEQHDWEKRQHEVAKIKQWEESEEQKVSQGDKDLKKAEAEEPPEVEEMEGQIRQAQMERDRARGVPMFNIGGEGSSNGFSMVRRAGAASDLINAQHGAEEPMVQEFEETPDTIIAPPPGPPDFNGHDAIIARHPNMGFAPTDLEENKMEARGSFTVQLARTGSQDEGEIALAIYGPPGNPFKCTLRGYRKLSADFQGNSVYTGFKKKFSGVRKINTGIISPGVTGEYDILTCRNDQSGETQYFRIGYGGTPGFADLRNNGPPNVLGDHIGSRPDNLDFDMDRPSWDDEAATDDYYHNYDSAADNKPFK